MTILIALLGCDPAGTEPKDGALPCLGCDSAEDDGPDTDDTDTGGGDTDSGIDDTDSGDTDVNDTDSGDTDVDDTGAVAPPRVILFVGDGMGFPHVQGGGLYAYGSAGSLVMEGLPYAGRLVTASLTGVTDSAAGATALATGHKTWNGVIGMDRELVAIESVLAAARARGLAGGIVTTDAITGATPASFYAHVSSRGDREEIAGQLLADPPEVVLGGGGATLDALLPGHDVQVVNTRTELYAATRDERPFFGVFAEDTLPFVVDGYDDQPTIAEMTAYALDVLDDDPDGFFLVVEGARIDHASHGNDGDKVHQETAAFDEAVAAAVAWASAGGYDPTVLVTADHECGGLEVSGGGAPGVVPDSEWRWGQHTNADIPVFGAGPFAEAIDGQRLDNTWVHAVLDAAVSGAATLTAPAESPIVDGRTADLGAAVVTQTWETSFGVGYNQLDGLRIFADEDGLRAGVDGVFEFGENAVLLLFDMDYGAGTGLGAEDTVLADTDGTMDAVLTAMPYTSGVAGMGFDLVFGSLGGEETLYADLSEVSGVRGLPGPWGAPDDYWWLWGTSNFDDGNLADGAAARDAAGTGLTEHGWEVQLRWTDLYPSGLPSTGLSVAVVAVLANGEGAYASNQALPPLPAADEPGTSPVLLESAVLLEVDAAGVPRGAATIVP